MSKELFITLDTETGGFNEEKNPLLQVGLYIAEYDTETFETTHVMSCLWDVNPHEYSDSVEAEAKALEVNHLTISELVEKGISLNQISKNIVENINVVINEATLRNGKRPRITLLGQNIAFDMRFIRRWLSKEAANILDSFQIEDLMSRIRDYNIIHPSYKEDGTKDDSRHLNDFLKKIDLENPNAHSALDDAKYTMLGYAKLSSIFKTGTHENAKT